MSNMNKSNVLTSVEPISEIVKKMLRYLFLKKWVSKCTQFRKSNMFSAPSSRG